MAVRRYNCAVIDMVTGRVVDEIPMASEPEFSQQINQPGSWAVTTQIGGEGGIPRAKLRQLVSPGKFGLAISYGLGSTADPILQAGPVWTHALVSESPPILKIGGSGFWGMPSARLHVPGTWISSFGFADTRSVATYGPTSLQGVAVGMLNDMLARGTLPLDVPSAIAGTVTQTYFGYNMALIGQKLSELTQQDQGPDVLFAPYYSDSSHVRWQALVGNPTITQPGVALKWDYGSNLTSVLPSSDGHALSTTSLVKGNGVEAAILWAMASDPTLTNAGWPLLEGVNSGHSDVTDQNMLNGYANADQALLGRPVETWTVRVKADLPPLLGTYNPGVTASYNMVGHCWVPDGEYAQRLLGVERSSAHPLGEAGHILQAIQGAV